MRAEVHGIRELQAVLRSIDASLPRELRKAGLKASDLVVAEARQRAGSLGGSARKAAMGVKPFADQRSVGVLMDARKHPYLFGAEFGALRWKQFPRWTGNKWTDPEGLQVGRFVHPAIRAKVTAVVDRYGAEIDGLIERIGE